MAFDGVVIANIVRDMQSLLTGGRISRISQPEKDELLLTVNNQKETYRLQISAGASLPIIRFVTENKKNPITAPNFCMLLRKHISNGRIISVDQPDMDRIVVITIEHRNELGDLCRKKLITELMGKHSNIIFTDDSGLIIDSIKHISLQVSSVREVLPGRPYSAPLSKGKIPLSGLTAAWITEELAARPLPVYKAVYQSLNGISPLLAQEICYRAGIDGDLPTAGLDEGQLTALYGELMRLLSDLEAGRFDPNIVFEGGSPLEFSSVALTMYKDRDVRHLETISRALTIFYEEKEVVTRMRQKSADLRHIIQTAIQRTARKLDLQRKQLKDTDKRDRYRIWGEMLHTYGYNLTPGQKELVCINYYDNKEIKVPLDPTLSPMDNAGKYFDRYNKLKRTYEALTVQVDVTEKELMHLESIRASLDIAGDEEDLSMIRDELVQYGYMKKRQGKGRKKPSKSRPLHYLSSDGFHMYVGKNNFQNDELTFRFANAGDMWFHAKQMAGSHVIVRLEQADDLPDRTYEEAARLAAYYSSGRNAPKVEVDYTRRGNLKKPPQSNPGYVIYHTNYSMAIEPDISGIKEL